MDIKIYTCFYWHRMVYNKEREGCKMQDQYKESICIYLHKCMHAKILPKRWSQLPAVVEFPLLFNSAVTCIDIIGNLSTIYTRVCGKYSAM